MDPAEFIERYAGIYEHSPWVAEQVAEQARPFGEARLEHQCGAAGDDRSGSARAGEGAVDRVVHA